MIEFITRIYACLLRLYPLAFRREFQEQMLLDFSDMATDASMRGKLSFALFCLHELIDFPINLCTMHWKEGGMLAIFRSKPVDYGLRGAAGFAVTFFLVGILEEFIRRKIDSYSDAIVDFLFEIFHTAKGLQFVFLISLLVSVLVTGLLFGIMLALLFADRSKYSRYIVVGMLSWFLSFAGTAICVATFNMDFYLGSKHASYLMQMMTVLSTLFLALMFVVAGSDKKGPYRALIFTTFAYPLSLYFYIQLLFKIGLVETPTMFLALVALIIIYIGSIFLIVVKCEDTLKMPWMFFVFVLGYFLVPYITRLIYWQLFPTPAVFYTEPQNWQLTFLMSMRVAFFEVPMGIFVGIVMTFQKKNSPLQIAA